MNATESPLGVLIVARDHCTGFILHSANRSRGRMQWSPQGVVLSYVIRILIPHPTTASAITKQVAVKAFSKADEAIALLSFAYPDEVSM